MNTNEAQTTTEPMPPTRHNEAAAPVDAEAQASEGDEVVDPQVDETQASECAQGEAEQGPSAVRTHKDLTGEHDAGVSYHSVKRVKNRLKGARPLPYRRLEVVQSGTVQHRAVAALGPRQRSPQTPGRCPPRSANQNCS